MACLCLNKLVQLFAAQIPFTLFLPPPRSTHSRSHTYIHLHTPFNQCTESQAWRSGVNLLYCWRQARGNEAYIKDQLPTPLCISPQTIPFSHITPLFLPSHCMFLPFSLLFMFLITQVSPSAPPLLLRLPWLVESHKKKPLCWVCTFYC